MKNNDKFSFDTSIRICFYMSIAWLIFYISVTLIFTKLKWLIPSFMLILISLLGIITVFRSLIKIRESWHTLKADNRIEVYNLCLVSISLYSIFLLGSMKYNTSLIYSLYIIIATLVAISIIDNEFDYYFPDNTKNKYVIFTIPRYNYMDGFGRSFVIAEHNVKAKENK